MADDSLHVDITADAEGAASAFSSLENRLAKLEEAFQKSATGAEGFAKGSHKAKIAAEEAGGAFSKLGGLFTDVEEHSRTVGIAFNAIGLKSEALAAKVAGLGQLFDGLGKAVPALLAVGTAVAAIGAAFDFAKDAADEAAHWQQNLAMLGQTVRDQGDDWKALQDSVQEWADLQERTTTYSRDEAVQALTTLTASGMKLADAQKTVRVAEDAAAATGRSLDEVVRGLMEAEHGRTQVLASMGLGTRANIRDGMSYNSVLALIEKNMGGSAAAASDTYIGKQKQLHNALVSLEENVGGMLLPFFTAIVTGLEKMIEAAERAAHTFALFGNVLRDVFEKSHWGDLKKDWGAFNAVFGTQSTTGFGVNPSTAGPGASISNPADTDTSVTGMVGGKAGSGGGSRARGGRGGHAARSRDGSGSAAVNPWADFVGTSPGFNATSDIGITAMPGSITDDKGVAKVLERSWLTVNDLATKYGKTLDADLKTADEEAKKREQAARRLYDEQQRYFSQLADQGMKVFDEIFSRGKKGVHGWGETFKSTLKDIEHALEKSLLMQMFAGMLGGKTNFGANFAGALGKGGSPLAGMFGSLLGGGSGHGASGAGAAGNASSSGVFGVVLGPSASAQAASSLPTDSLTSFMFGVGAPQVNGGGGGAASGVLGSIGGAGGAGGAGGVASILGADATGGTSGVERSIIAQVGAKGLGNVFKGGIPGISKALGFGQGSIWEGTSHSLSLGGAAVGVGAGQLFGNLWSQGAGGGSHSTWGSIAGGIGGAIGGPVGGIVGAAIGSAFGHADNPHDMPDKYDTQNYGTIIANLIGHAGANGQNFSMDSTIASIVGTNPVTGQSQSIQGASGDHWNSGGSIAFIEEMLAKYGSADKAPTWLQPMFNQMVGMFGMSSTGAGHLNFGQHLNNEHITGAQGVNGQTYQYTDLGKAAEQFFEAYMQQGQVGTSASVNTNPGNGAGTSNNPFQVVNPFSNLPVFNVGNGMPASVVPYTSPAAGGPGEVMHGAPVAPTTPPISPPNWSQIARTLTGGNPWGFKSAPSVTVNVQGSLITQGQVASVVGSAISGAKWQSPFSSNAVQYGLDNA